MDSSFYRRAFTSLLAFAGIVLFFRYLLVPLLPFLLALGLSALLEPSVQRLRRAIGVKRSFAAAVLTTAVLGIAGSAAVFLVLRLAAEFTAWSARLPEAIAAFPGLWNSILDRLEGWYAACPPFARSALDMAATTLGDNASALLVSAGRIAMDAVSSIAAALPGIGLFCVTTVLALYFTGSGYSTILAFLKRQLPAPWQARCRAAVHCCRKTMLGWIRSELLLILATFLLLLLGFWWMGLEYALLAAFAIALVDALPVVGTGGVIIPWAIFRLLVGDTREGLALLIIYAAALLTHSLLEPRLLAGQADLPPITALLAMYLGYHFMGVGGMLLLPILLLLLKQLQDAGVVRLWR